MSNVNPQPSPKRPANEIVAANIRAELGYKGLKPADLARMIDQNDMWLTRRLSTKYKAEFSANEIGTIAEKLDVSAGDLFVERSRNGGGARLVGLSRSKGWKLPHLDSNQEPIG